MSAEARINEYRERQARADPDGHRGASERGRAAQSNPPELPEPRKAPDRTPEPGAVAAPTTPKPPTLVGQLRRAAEQGQAGYLWLDWTTAGSTLPNVLAQFSATDHFAREGRGPAGVTVVVGRNGPRSITLEVSGGGRNHDRRTFEPERGTEADISNPAVVDWIAREVADVRDAPFVAGMPVLVVLTPEVVPDVIDGPLRDRLDLLAADVPACVAALQDHAGFAPSGRAEIQWTPMLNAEPWQGDFPNPEDRRDFHDAAA